ncbi:MAG: hypothetical protein HC810_05510, partial [Acaryochloridaceae cyanobacterium RL_2_7]|nr:hypothetical protein [Acaryochloridaceae cyanobacterium RL_2_7]
MDVEVLEYQRDRALDWLRQRIQESESPDKVDRQLDALIREIAGLQEGQLYGFVRVPQQPSEGSSSGLKPSQIRSRRETFIKIKPIASNYLLEKERIALDPDVVIEVANLKQDKHQHHWIQLPNGHQGYIYSPHWEFSEAEKKKDVKLNVPYFNQRDNWDRFHGPGGRQCNLTSHAMAADYLLKGEISKQAKAKHYLEAEDLYGEVLYKYGDTTNPQAHTPALKDFGIESYFSYSGSIKDLLLCLDKGIPVPLGVAYKASGHYVCAVGYRSDGVYVHDPFGIRMGQTDNYENASGDYDF